MLFFTKAEVKGTPPLPPEELLEVGVKTWEMLISYKQQGKILARGAVVGGMGGRAIWEVDSIEELHRLISQLPGSRFTEWETTPLITHEQALESSKQALAALRQSKK